MIKYSIKFMLLILMTSCQEKPDLIFSEVRKNRGSQSFVRENKTFNLDDTTTFRAYRFSKNDRFDVYGYWGKIRDTIYFVNPQLQDDSCFVKFPILILNGIKKQIVEQSSNCNDSPLMGMEYYIEILSQDGNTYQVKHILEEDFATGNTYNLITLSLEFGILDFKEFSKSDHAFIPWSLGIKKLKSN